MDAGAGFERRSCCTCTTTSSARRTSSPTIRGAKFQRHECFPSGEIWISDQQEEIRTPFQFGDGCYEEHFEIVLFGGRWYDTERELFLAPDPAWSADPRATIDNPGLLGAYTYAGAAPVIDVDPTGRTPSATTSGST
jgi:RHS repeat-associated protein